MNLESWMGLVNSAPAGLVGSDWVDFGTQLLQVDFGTRLLQLVVRAAVISGDSLNLGFAVGFLGFVSVAVGWMLPKPGWWP